MVKPSTHQRYTLKVHYLVYPTNLPFYGKLLGRLTSVYDNVARLGFLMTLTPKTSFQKLYWRFIMWSTLGMFSIIRAAGNSGAFSFVVACGVIAYFVPSELPVFMCATSFIHYMVFESKQIYIGTYYHQKTLRHQIAFEAFKHTVFFYKAVSMYHLFALYLQTMTSIDFISLGMIAGGFGLSAYATFRIGIGI
jgi:hypothetical protein